MTFPIRRSTCRVMALPNNSNGDAPRSHESALGTLGSVPGKIKAETTLGRFSMKSEERRALHLSILRPGFGFHGPEPVVGSSRNVAVRMICACRPSTTLRSHRRRLRPRPALRASPPRSPGPPSRAPCTHEIRRVCSSRDHTPFARRARARSPVQSSPHRPGSRRAANDARDARLRDACRARRGGGAARDPHGVRSRPPACADRDRRARRAARDRAAEPRHEVDDRARLLRDAHAAGRAAQGAREPRLVHRVHALPAGDLAGPARGAAQLPDDGRRPQRPACRERIAARRGDRGRRGDGHLPACEQGRGCELRRRRGLPPADDRGRPDARRAARGAGSSCATWTRACPRARSPACCCSTPGRAARCATTRR